MASKTSPKYLENLLASDSLWASLAGSSSNTEPPQITFNNGATNHFNIGSGSFRLAQSMFSSNSQAQSSAKLTTSYQPESNTKIVASNPYSNGAGGVTAFGTATPVSSVLATTVQNINALLVGTKWASTSVTYSFTDSISDYESGYDSRASHATTFASLTAAQRAAARSWFDQYYNASMLTFTELAGVSDRDATIRMARSAVPGTAFAYYPSGSFVEGGDAWFNVNGYLGPTIGTYDYHTFGHELGHALGLKHGHELGGVTNQSLTADRDSMEFSIMTYRSFVNHNLTTLPYYTNAYGHYAQTLMMYDIAAIQHMYGPWFGYNSGNTVYTFSPTTGEMFINGISQGTPAANVIFRTIWDGNGIDTYDLSNYTTNQSIDLNPGAWSNFATNTKAQLAILNNGYGGQTVYARAHIFNALQYNNDSRSLIENAIGGSGNDTIYGNTANNRLEGGNGNDIIDARTGTDTTLGGNGNDIIRDGDYVDFDNHDGGAGVDTISYQNVTFAGASLVEINLGRSRVSVTGGNTEWITNFENVTGSQGGETIIGSSLANIISGLGGDDIINPGAGTDKCTGGAGSDRFIFQFGRETIASVDSITDFQVGIDKIQLLSYMGSVLSAPTSFTRAADTSAAITLDTLMSLVFNDCDGLTLGNQGLGLNSASLVSVTGSNAGTYIIANDDVFGYQSANDLIIRVTGLSSLPALGSITTSNFFA